MDTKNINLIWSADGIPQDTLYQILGRDDFPRDRVGIKLDRLFLTIYGLKCISEIQEQFQIPVFADAKIIEVPSKVLEITKLHLEHRPWMLNVMAGACDKWQTRSDKGVESEKDYDLLYHFAKLCEEVGTKSCAVTVLTSKTPHAISCEFNTTPENAVIDYARLMENCGLTDIVCSPQEATALREDECYMDINTPGVRLPGSSVDDQSRIDTPHGAISSGAKRVIMGRDIYRTGESYDVIAPHIEKILANIEGRDQNE